MRFDSLSLANSPSTRERKRALCSPYSSFFCSTNCGVVRFFLAVAGMGSPVKLGELRTEIVIRDQFLISFLKMDAK